MRSKKTQYKRKSPSKRRSTKKRSTIKRSTSSRPVFSKSKVKGKKYAVHFSGKTINFGALGYQHYKDRTPLKLYKHLDHNDKKRRESYRKRHWAIKLKDGRLAYKVKTSPEYWASKYLW